MTKITVLSSNQIVTDFWNQYSELAEMLQEILVS